MKKREYVDSDKCALVYMQPINMNFFAKIDVQIKGNLILYLLLMQI